ncbi:hypothetical protein E2C01_092081 [Portunus trituberculatus]|uniref:Uncharacterized protein n=1 Tax=Portunus trituberculatus TaxID=210409 RepID=A0A5B7JQT2_PORTR|nr:hypothetical protein [Portunus trituberculatus]
MFLVLLRVCKHCAYTLESLKARWTAARVLKWWTLVRRRLVGEVVAAQDLPVANRQLCGVTGHCMTLRGPVMSTITVGSIEENLPAFVADMEEPCLVGLGSLVQSAVCVDSGRIQMQVCEEMLPLILEDAAEQVEPRDEFRC